MILYLVPRPPDKLGRKSRESGWRHVPFDRQARKEMEAYGDQLRDKGITAVYCSDLDTKYAEVLRNKLDAPNVRPDFQLRRFNVGRHHAAPISDIDRIFQTLIARWKTNPDIPMRGGDSRTSFEKRFVKTYQKLLEQDGSAALIVDCRTLSVIRDLSTNQYSGVSLCPNGNAPNMTKLYKVENAVRTNTAMEHSAQLR